MMPSKRTNCRIENDIIEKIYKYTDEDHTIFKQKFCIYY